MKKAGAATKPIGNSCIAFGRLAKNAARYLASGRKITLQGRLSYKQYTDQKGGERYRTEIHVHDMMVLA